jgi:hypothetical protein
MIKLLTFLRNDLLRYFGVINRTQSKRWLSKSFNLPKPSSKNSYFKYNKVEYARCYAKWNCSNKNCKNSWLSAYTWISFDALKVNKKLFKNYDFSGSNFKSTDFLQQICKSCNSKINQIIYYNNLEKRDDVDERKPHIRKLCIKCQKGYYCNEDWQY